MSRSSLLTASHRQNRIAALDFVFGASLLLAATGCFTPENASDAPLPATAAGMGPGSDATAAPPATGGKIPVVTTGPLFEEIAMPVPAVAPVIPDEGRTGRQGAAEVSWGKIDAGSAIATGTETATTPERARRDGDPFAQRLQQLLAELAPFDGRKESDLAQGERLKKYRIQSQLVALHFLLPRELQSTYLEPLLRSLEKPADPPAKAHLLLVASLYHDLDLADLRDATLARLQAQSSAPQQSPATPGHAPALRELQLCKRIGGFRDFDPSPPTAVRGGEKFKLYGELTHLQPRREDDVYRFCIEAVARLYRATGGEVRRIALSRPGGDFLARDQERAEHFLCYDFTVPEGLDPGDYRLAVEVGDLYGKQTLTAEIPLKIRAR